MAAPKLLLNSGLLHEALRLLLDSCLFLLNLVIVCLIISAIFSPFGVSFLNFDLRISTEVSHWIAFIRDIVDFVRLGPRTSPVFDRVLRRVGYGPNCIVQVEVGGVTCYSDCWAVHHCMETSLWNQDVIFFAAVALYVSKQGWFVVWVHSVKL